jgi:thiamine biosynthesis lipoprotein
LLDDNHIVLRRPLWLDLGGIAKGYAVDRAIDVLRAHGASQACVNAGGDLRMFGARAEPVFIRVGRGGARQVPAVELADAAIATSTSDSDGDGGLHLHGVTRVPLRGGMSVSVIAARCVIADALTKIVLAGDAEVTRNVLDAFAAEAFVQDPAYGWQRLGRAA